MVYPPPSAHAYHQRTQLNTRSKYQDVSIYVLDASELLEFWVVLKRSEGVPPQQIIKKLKELGLDVTVTTLELVRDQLSNAKSSLILTALARDMSRAGSIFTHYYTTNQGGKEYIVFKGNHRLRTMITGTRYLATNTKMMHFGIGGTAVKAMAKSGFLVSVFFSTSLHSVRWLFEEDYRWSDWLSYLSVDIAKITMAGISGYLAATSITGSYLLLAGAAPVVLPIAAGVFVCFATGMILATYNDEKIIQNIKQSLEEVEQEIHNLDRTLKDGVYLVLESSKNYAIKEARLFFMAKLRTLLQRFNPVCRC